MTEEKFLLLNLEDNKSKELAQVMSSDTARKILNFLANKPLSETEIAEKLSLPLPTVHYNIKQLLNSGIIEIKDFLWSEKGKKIQLYQLANKIIIISPKNSNPSFMEKLKDIIPVALSGFLISAGIYIYQLFNKKFYGYSAERLISGASNSIMQKTSESNISQVGQTTQLVMPFTFSSEIAYPTNSYNQNNQYYTVTFDGEGEASVIGKLNFYNFGKNQINNIRLEIPGNNIRIINIVQEYYGYNAICAHQGYEECFE